MFDIGVTELLVIAVVAIIVVGPRELPRMLRTIGQVVSKAKGLAREFQTQFEEAADDAGVTKIKEDFEELGDFSEDIDFDGAFDPIKDVGEDLKETITDEPKPAKKPVKKAAKKPARKPAKKPAKPKASSKASSKGATS